MAPNLKLAVASVTHATPRFLPRPEIIYINVLHYSALPKLIYYMQHRLYAHIGAIDYRYNSHFWSILLHQIYLENAKNHHS